MTGAGTTVSTNFDVPLDSSEAFGILFEELAATLVRSEYRVELGSDGYIMQDDFVVGEVTSWRPGEQAIFEWRPASWNPDETTEVDILFDSTDAGTRITIEHRMCEKLIEEPTDMVGWFATAMATPFLDAITPRAFGEWLTDRQGRRPTGEPARSEYDDPLFHYPNFRVILEELALTQEDYLLEVGSGGGALLQEALASGCRAAAVDHSPDMVELTRRNNSDAVEADRLAVHEANAENLPFPDTTFTCATMTGVLGHLSNPVAVLTEIHRVLEIGGRIAILGSDPELRGTDAAPEPAASRMHFYGTDALRRLAIEAEFEDVQVERRNLRPYARDVGIPDQYLSLFDYPARFLLARKN